MAWAMAPVGSDGFRSCEGGAEGGADLQRVRRVLVAQVSIDGRLSVSEDFLVAVDSMPRQRCQGWRLSVGSSWGVFVVICSALYLGLHISFGGKPDENRLTRRDGIGRRVRAACCPNKVGSSGCALRGALEELARVEEGQTGRSVRRRTRAYLQREVHTEFVRTDGWFRWVETLNVIYDIEHEMKVHTGTSLSIKVGNLHANYIKKKLNVKSSTKSELVVVGGCMPQVLWKTYSFESQRYEMDAEIIYQDNNSAMLLEKHGTLSRIRRANHINARYYFIANKVPNVQVQLEQCPTWDIKLVRQVTRRNHGYSKVKWRKFWEYKKTRIKNQIKTVKWKKGKPIKIPSSQGCIGIWDFK